MSNHKRYVLGHVNGEVVVQGGRDRAPECCENCGAAYHRLRPCRTSGWGDANEGHRGDEGDES